MSCGVCTQPQKKQPSQPPHALGHNLQQCGGLSESNQFLPLLGSAIWKATLSPCSWRYECQISVERSGTAIYFRSSS
ncbi:hypothetical protein TNIN_146271 [Trichonephila inaurata madagascariensis]|uniref:Uncharacterized protein n=1 Tax=Trichonephila inaurata madagascariensis TaxID=2747483 RepID=A0A8X6IKW6_9ARAC|nr:hypothetical protein TNIN_146271 [Trichonephila inaurata madagascariensis]